MADRITDREDIKDRNKDAEESGRPVQLDPEQPGGKPGQQQGQPDKPQHDKQGTEHGHKPGQQQNR